MTMSEADRRSLIAARHLAITQRLRQRRDDLGLTQKQIVTRLARCGLQTTNRALSSLEHGAGLDIAKLPELAKALDCTVTYLIGLTDDPHRWEPDAAPPAPPPRRGTADQTGAAAASPAPGRRTARSSSARTCPDRRLPRRDGGSWPAPLSRRTGRSISAARSAEIRSSAKPLCTSRYSSGCERCRDQADVDVAHDAGHLDVGDQLAGAATTTSRPGSPRHISRRSQARRVAST